MANENVKTIMISLLGGRPLPNILAAIHLKPDRLYIVASKDSLQANGNYEKAINALPKHLAPLEPHAVRPYDLSETVQQCEKIAAEHPEDKIIVVSASEPKTMAFGAYDFAKHQKMQGRDIDMCCVSGEGLVWLFSNKMETLKIGLEEYFSAYSWAITLKQDCPKLDPLIKVLIENLSVSHELLRRLREKGQGKTGQFSLTVELHEDAFRLLKKIESLGFVSGVNRENNSTSCTINNNGKGQYLLTGDWLEYHVYQVSSELKDQTGKPLFDECAWGVEDKNGKGEIDFVGIFRGQLIIASCKTEASTKNKRPLFQDLHSKAEQIGKSMCTRLLISSVAKQQNTPAEPNEKTQQDIKNWEIWAKERQIVLVMAEDLENLPAILHKLVTGDNNAAPEHIPCYARI